MFPMVTYDRITQTEANRHLVAWGHKMGPILRGNQHAVCFALIHDGAPVAITTHSSLIRETVQNAHFLLRDNTVELSRLCAARPGLCRVALRLWREFAFPETGKAFAMSYQDADIHTGNTYRFDGWSRVAYAHSGTDTRSGRKGRNKWVWIWPPTPNPPEEKVAA